MINTENLHNLTNAARLLKKRVPEIRAERKAKRNAQTISENISDEAVKPAIISPEEALANARAYLRAEEAPQEVSEEVSEEAPIAEVAVTAMTVEQFNMALDLFKKEMLEVIDQRFETLKEELKNGEQYSRVLKDSNKPAVIVNQNQRSKGNGWRAAIIGGLALLGLGAVYGVRSANQSEAATPSMTAAPQTDSARPGNSTVESRDQIDNQISGLPARFEATEESRQIVVAASVNADLGSQIEQALQSIASRVEARVTNAPQRLPQTTNAEVRSSFVCPTGIHSEADFLREAHNARCLNSSLTGRGFDINSLNDSNLFRGNSQDGAIEAAAAKFNLPVDVLRQALPVDRAAEMYVVAPDGTVGRIGFTFTNTERFDLRSIEKTLPRSATLTYVYQNGHIALVMDMCGNLIPGQDITKVVEPTLPPLQPEITLKDTQTPTNTPTETRTNTPTNIPTETPRPTPTPEYIPPVVVTYPNLPLFTVCLNIIQGQANFEAVTFNQLIDTANRYGINTTIRSDADIARIQDQISRIRCAQIPVNQNLPLPIPFCDLFGRTGYAANEFELREYARTHGLFAGGNIYDVQARIAGLNCPTILIYPSATPTISTPTPFIITNTPVFTETPTNTATPTATLRPGETPTITLTPTNTATAIATEISTPTPIPTNTDVIPTATVINLPSETPTATPRATVETPTPSPIPTNTDVPFPTATVVDMPSVTPTNTATPRATVETPTPSPIPTNVDVPFPTATIVNVPSVTPSNTPTPRPTVETSTPSPMPTNVDVPFPTATIAVRTATPAPKSPTASPRATVETPKPSPIPTNTHAPIPTSTIAPFPTGIPVGR